MRNILLGVCGGISSYKSAELVREFRRRGCAVRVIMTDAAQQFVTKLTFESLSNHAVYTNLFGDGAFGTAHIETARWADALVIAPATADTIARFAQGRADDFLSTVYLAYKGRVVLAPAMNTAMWEHPAVQANLETVKRRGAEIVPPQDGELACGEIGAGKMAEPATIADWVAGKLPDSPLLHKRVVITAGPTREYIDAVRFLSSPSSGKMGLAVAREAVRRGADVTVIHGPLSETPDFEAAFTPVVSASEMHGRVAEATPADIFVGTAAVADFQMNAVTTSKIKKKNEPLHLDLVPTTDILAAVSAARRPGDIVVGFAAETENVAAYAKQKLETKNLDLCVGNAVDREKKGFVQGRTSVTFVDHETSESFEDISKDAVAVELWNRVEKLLHDRR